MLSPNHKALDGRGFSLSSLVNYFRNVVSRSQSAHTFSYHRAFSPILFNSLYIFTLFLLPTQLGRHFWPPFAMVGGLRIDYLSPTVYLTDVFLFLLFCIAAIQFISKKNKQQIFTKTFSFFSYHPFLTVGVLSLLVGMMLSHRPILSVFSVIRIGEIAFFAWCTMRFLQKSVKAKNIIVGVFSVTLIFESLLGVAQFFAQRSFGGAFYWLGERSFSIQTPGIANASLNGMLVLRPYGTFSHPNVLAGFLLLGIVVVGGHFFIKKTYGSSRFFLLLALCLSSLCLLLTLSRITIILFFLLLFVFAWFWLVKKHHLKNKKSLHISIIAIATMVLFLMPLLLQRFSPDDFFGESYEQRKMLVLLALKMIQDHPLFGVGSNQFIVVLPAYLSSVSFPLFQPVHNVFFLLSSETGLLGLMGFLELFLIVLLRIKSQQSRIPLVLLFCLLLLGMSDHYFFTQQQGRLLMGFVFGLVLTRNIRLPLEKKYPKKLI